MSNNNNKFKILSLITMLLISLLNVAYASSNIVVTQGKFIKGVAYDVVKVPASKVHTHWKNDEGKPFGSMSKLKMFLKSKKISPIVIMNAGIYTENNNPAGLYIEKGKVLKTINTNKGAGNFHLEPNGVFLIDKSNNAKIITTKKFLKYSKKNIANIRLATQSGPMLLINGKIHSKFKKESKSLYVRNAVCISNKKNADVYFIISKKRVNLYTFAEAIKSLGCKNSLYLDGSISKMHIDGKNGIFHFVTFVAMLSAY